MAADVRGTRTPARGEAGRRIPWLGRSNVVALGERTDASSLFSYPLHDVGRGGIRSLVLVGHRHAAWVGAARYVVRRRLDGARLALITIGLLSSTFHLGHPERAWRRSVSGARLGSRAKGGRGLSYIPAGLLGIAWIFLSETSGQWITLIATLAWIGALATVFCTGQIYASLPTIRQWNHLMTTPVYLFFALASGSLCLNALMRLFVSPAQWCDILVIVSVVCAWVAKRSYWRGIDTARELHTVESATGLGHLGKVKLLDPPHSSENYLMQEMGFKVARKHARRLRAIALGQRWGYFVPLVATLALLNIVGPLDGILAAGRVGFRYDRHCAGLTKTHGVLRRGTLVVISSTSASGVKATRSPTFPNRALR